MNRAGHVMVNNSNCLEVQFSLMVIAPTEVAKCSTGITNTITSVYQSDNKETLDEDDKEKLFRQLVEFATLVRKDLDLPNTSLELDAKLASNMEEAVVSAASRNYDKYFFAGEALNKRRLVLAVVKYAVEKKNVQTFKQLNSLFPKDWHSEGKQRRSKQAVVYLKTEAEQNGLRFFGQPEDIIALPDGSVAVVNNQWGTNVNYFVVKANEALGVEISKKT